MSKRKSERKIIQRYLPKTLSKKDAIKQKAYINKSRKAYPKGIFINRPFVESFKSKASPHVYRATNLYGVPNMIPNSELARATGCKQWALKKIIEKGEGAYYSSGSRPNQTPQSWGYARLGSALTGGPSSQVDYKILEKGCSRRSRPIRLANQFRKTSKKLSKNKS
jgi:hypothetical protein